MRSGSSRRRPLWQVLIADILLAGAALLVFAYFHHVRPAQLASEDMEIARPTQAVAQVTAAPEAVATPAPASEQTAHSEPTPAAHSEPTPVPTPDPVGVFAQRHAGKFTDGEVISSDEDGVYTYKSKYLNITVSEQRVSEDSSSGTGESTVYVTDFYVRDITCLQGVFAADSFSQGNYEWLEHMAKRTDAVAAVNGDFCTMRKYGVVVRNGKLYRSSHSSFDACAIYWDGTMETYFSDDWNGKTIANNGAYMAFSFGPKLLDKSGQPLKKFNQTDAVNKRNPRTAIGYFEPGHYCFVTVDGRGMNSSKGLKMEGLAQFMASLGCKAAYNLDGGESSSLWFMGDIISHPYQDGRKISDALILKDLAED